MENEKAQSPHNILRQDNLQTTLNVRVKECCLNNNCEKLTLRFFYLTIDLTITRRRRPCTSLPSSTKI